MPDYLVRFSNGMVHRRTCRHAPSASHGCRYDPEKADLAPGVQACDECLPDGLPQPPPVAEEVVGDLAAEQRLEGVVGVLKTYASTYPNGRSKLYYQIWNAINGGGRDE